MLAAPPTFMVLNGNNKNNQLNKTIPSLNVYEPDPVQKKGRGQVKIEAPGLFLMDVNNVNGIVVCAKNEVITALFGSGLEQKVVSNFDEPISGLRISKDGSLLVIGFKQSNTLSLFNLSDFLDTSSSPSAKSPAPLAKLKVIHEFSQIHWSPVNNKYLLVRNNETKQSSLIINYKNPESGLYSLRQEELVETYCISFDLSGNIIYSDNVSLTTLSPENVNSQICDVYIRNVVTEIFDPIFAFEEYKPNQWILIGQRMDEEDPDTNATSIVPLTGSFINNTIKPHDPYSVKFNKDDEDEALVAKIIQGRQDTIEKNLHQLEFKIIVGDSNKILIVQSVLSTLTLIEVKREGTLFKGFPEDSQIKQKVDTFADLLRGAAFCTFEDIIVDNNDKESPYACFIVNSDKRYYQELPNFFITYDTKYVLQKHYLCQDFTTKENFEAKTAGQLPEERKPKPAVQLILPQKTQLAEEPRVEQQDNRREEDVNVMEEEKSDIGQEQTNPITKQQTPEPSQQLFTGSQTNEQNQPQLPIQQVDIASSIGSNFMEGISQLSSVINNESIIDSSRAEPPFEQQQTQQLSSAENQSSEASQFAQTTSDQPSIFGQHQSQKINIPTGDTNANSQKTPASFQDIFRNTNATANPLFANLSFSNNTFPQGNHNTSNAFDFTQQKPIQQQPDQQAERENQTNDSTANQPTKATTTGIFNTQIAQIESSSSQESQQQQQQQQQQEEQKQLDSTVKIAAETKKSKPVRVPSLIPTVPMPSSLTHQLTTELQSLKAYMTSLNSNEEAKEEQPQQEGYIFDQFAKLKAYQSQIRLSQNSDNFFKLNEDPLTQPSLYSVEYFFSFDTFAFATYSPTQNTSSIYLLTSESYEDINDQMSKLVVPIKEAMAREDYERPGLKTDAIDDATKTAKEAIIQSLQEHLVLTTNTPNILSIHNINNAFLVVAFTGGFYLLSVSQLKKAMEDKTQINLTNEKLYAFTEAAQSVVLNRSKSLLAIVSSNSVGIYETFTGQLLHKEEGGQSVAFSHDATAKAVYIMKKDIIRYVDLKDIPASKNILVPKEIITTNESQNIHFEEFTQGKFVTVVIRDLSRVEVFVALDGVQIDDESSSLQFKRVDIDKSMWSVVEELSEQEARKLQCRLIFNESLNLLALIFNYASSFAQIQLKENGTVAVEVDQNLPNWVSLNREISAVIPIEVQLVNNDPRVFCYEGKVKQKQVQIVTPIMQSVFVFNGMFNLNRFIVVSSKKNKSVPEDKNIEEIKNNRNQLSPLTSLDEYEAILKGENASGRKYSLIQTRINEIQWTLEGVKNSSLGGASVQLTASRQRRWNMKQSVDQLLAELNEIEFASSSVPVNLSTLKRPVDVNSMILSRKEKDESEVTSIQQKNKVSQSRKNLLQLKEDVEVEQLKKATISLNKVKQVTIYTKVNGQVFYAIGGDLYTHEGQQVKVKGIDVKKEWVISYIGECKGYLVLVYEKEKNDSVIALLKLETDYEGEVEPVQLSVRKEPLIVESTVNKEDTKQNNSDIKQLVMSAQAIAKASANTGQVVSSLVITGKPSGDAKAINTQLSQNKNVLNKQKLDAFSVEMDESQKATNVFEKQTNLFQFTGTAQTSNNQLFSQQSSGNQSIFAQSADKSGQSQSLDQLVALQAGGLFGSQAPQTQKTVGQAPQSQTQQGGLWQGLTPSALQLTTTPSSSLFGATPAPDKQLLQTQQFGGLFGPTAGDKQLRQTGQNGGLFGATPAQDKQSTQKQYVGGLFGAPFQTGNTFETSNKSQPPNSTGGLFEKPSVNLFDQNTTSNQKPDQQQQEQPLLGLVSKENRLLFGESRNSTQSLGIFDSNREGVQTVEQYMIQQNQSTNNIAVQNLFNAPNQTINASNLQQTAGNRLFSITSEQSPQLSLFQSQQSNRNQNEQSNRVIEIYNSSLAQNQSQVQQEQLFNPSPLPPTQVIELREQCVARLLCQIPIDGSSVSQVSLYESLECIEILVSLSNKQEARLFFVYTGSISVKPVHVQPKCYLASFTRSGSMLFVGTDSTISEGIIKQTKEAMNFELISQTPLRQLGIDKWQKVTKMIQSGYDSIVLLGVSKVKEGIMKLHVASFLASGVKGGIKVLPGLNLEKEFETAPDQKKASVDSIVFNNVICSNAGIMCVVSNISKALFCFGVSSNCSVPRSIELVVNVEKVSNINGIVEVEDTKNELKIALLEANSQSFRKVTLSKNENSREFRIT